MIIAGTIRRLWPGEGSRPGKHGLQRYAGVVGDGDKIAACNKELTLFLRPFST